MHTALTALRISEGGLALGGTYRNHPVSQVTVLRHLHCPQHGQVDVTSAMGKSTVSIHLKPTLFSFNTPCQYFVDGNMTRVECCRIFRRNQLSFTLDHTTINKT